MCMFFAHSWIVIQPWIRYPGYHQVQNPSNGFEGFQGFLGFFSVTATFRNPGLGIMGDLFFARTFIWLSRNHPVNYDVSFLLGTSLHWMEDCPRSEKLQLYIIYTIEKVTLEVTLSIRLEVTLFVTLKFAVAVPTSTTFWRYNLIN